MVAISIEVLNVDSLSNKFNSLAKSGCQTLNIEISYIPLRLEWARPVGINPDALAINGMIVLRIGHLMQYVFILSL